MKEKIEKVIDLLDEIESLINDENVRQTPFKKVIREAENILVDIIRGLGNPLVAEQ